MNDFTIEILNEPKLESYSGGGLKEIVAIVKCNGKRVGTIDNYLQMGYVPYAFPEATGTVTSVTHYPTIELAYKAGIELNLFNMIS